VCVFVGVGVGVCVFVCACVCVCRLLHSGDSETCRLNIPVSSFQPTTNRGFVKHWGRIHLLGRHGTVSRRAAVPVVCNAETHAAVTFNSTYLFSSLSLLHRLFVLYRPLLIRFILFFFFTFPLPLSSYFVLPFSVVLLRSLCSFFHSSPFLSSALIRSNGCLPLLHALMETALSISDVYSTNS